MPFIHIMQYTFHSGGFLGANIVQKLFICEIWKLWLEAVQFTVRVSDLYHEAILKVFLCTVRLLCSAYVLGTSGVESLPIFLHLQQLQKSQRTNPETISPV